MRWSAIQFIFIGGVWTAVTGWFLHTPQILWAVLLGDRGEALFALPWVTIPVLPGFLMLVAGLGLLHGSGRRH